MADLIRTLISTDKNFVVIGETGSGKTEISMNLAIGIAAQKQDVHYFDMDQTKPILRARDNVSRLEKAGITFHYEEQHLDTPIVSSGLNELLMKPKAYVIMDIGGGDYGSHMIGQFAHLINRPETTTLYILNPYRLWSQNTEDILHTLSKVKKAARIQDVMFVANPNIGSETDTDTVLDGMKKLGQMLEDKVKLSFVCVPASLTSALKGKIKEPVFPIVLNPKPDWF